MSTNAIHFLEALGASPVHADASYADDVATLPVDPAQRAALLGRDPAALARLLEARPTMICMIVAPNGDVPDDGMDEDDHDLEDAPEQPAHPSSPESDK